MEAAVEKNLREEAFHLELVTKKLNTCNVFQVTPVSFIFLFFLYKIIQSILLLSSSNYRFYFSNKI